jgi:hypothetical protein
MKFGIRIYEFILHVNTLMEFRPFLPTHSVDVNWGLVDRLPLPAKVTTRANKVIGIMTNLTNVSTVQSSFKRP